MGGGVLKSNHCIQQQNEGPERQWRVALAQAKESTQEQGSWGLASTV